MNDGNDIAVTSELVEALQSHPTLGSDAAVKLLAAIAEIAEIAENFRDRRK